MSRQLAIVTGAGSGIGRAIAWKFADAGYQVVGADLNDDAAAESAAKYPDMMTAEHVDVADAESVTSLCRAVTAIGTPATIVNAAGWDRTDKFINEDAEFARKVVEINYLGPVAMCREFARVMIDAGRGGRIVNIASDAGRVGSAGETIYAGAKGGVIAFTKSLARELARDGINVNCVCPGPTDTPLFAAQPEHLRQALIKSIPFRRVAEPSEIADAVYFFASPASRYVTGQILSVDGGLTMAG
ncbi:SDR family NAD(P)-dependent oxidoreductase [Spelaeicoccus albus]|uniref:NAD(P)-dependent dehydrogenase (Short-subunit alcohol dehydrogenase family) n=1 Tax=Spelaeicoccus albus TaxID=1280376 RepID=A0A7Z0IIA6_9MICO|nr:SDR family oxidoreductase [Spelaeicoccus albus]NYI68300.1 NAD(P)-dependent dehydrogenase (short-subunit alcohol dehydrogenase family) [Spelaeicoccus albus]